MEKVNIYIYIYTWDESDFIFSDSNRCITCNAPETSYNKNYMVTGPCFLWYPETNPTGRPSPLHCVPAKWWRWAVLPKLSHEWTGSKMRPKTSKNLTPKFNMQDAGFWNWWQLFVETWQEWLIQNSVSHILKDTIEQSQGTCYCGQNLVLFQLMKSKFA